MEVVLGRELLHEMLNFAKERHPKEAILLLRGKIDKERINITEYLFPPYATTNSVYATFPLHMLPIDFSIIGTAHSHPSGSLKLSAEDMNNVYGRISLLIVYPYGEGDVGAFNKQSERVMLRIID